MSCTSSGHGLSFRLPRCDRPPTGGWRVGALCGPSGSGKSVNLRNLGQEARPVGDGRPLQSPFFGYYSLPRWWLQWRSGTGMGMQHVFGFNKNTDSVLLSSLSPFEAPVPFWHSIVRAKPFSCSLSEAVLL